MGPTAAEAVNGLTDALQSRQGIRL